MASQRRLGTALRALRPCPAAADGGLAGKTVLVTGGSRGVGAAACSLFAERGCRVVVGFNSNADAAEAVVSGLANPELQHVAVQGDVGTAEGCRNLWEGAVAALGQVDILVNNAGVGANFHHVLESDLDTWTEAFSTILVGHTPPAPSQPAPG